MKKTLVLMILDGFGHSDNSKYNAISQANTPHWDQWKKNHPYTLLDASGTAVGLPANQMGNSEVGHMHMGAGRVICQELTRINEAINSGTFFKNQCLLDAITTLKKSNKSLHILGLFSEGGVHAHETHLYAFLKLAHEQGFNNIYLHLFLDGRDSPPRSALKSLATLQTTLTAYPVARIASISGRYFAMDRDNRWDRTEKIYRLLTEGHTEHTFQTAEEAIAFYYGQGINDEFIPPTIIGRFTKIQSQDTLFFTNFRADRMRQLVSAFTDKAFNGFTRIKPPGAQVVTMVSYAKNLITDCVFPPQTLRDTLGEIIAKKGLSQLRIAETEKYAHVTFFFNGGIEQPFPQEERILIPSPLVATYNLTPEMSAGKLTHVLAEAIKTHEYDLIICNYANADMVGHTGDFKATRVAIECLDSCLSIIWNTLQQENGSLIVTADHGNAEIMFDDTTHDVHTAHTNEPVPFLYLGSKDYAISPLSSRSLIDIAPTVLYLLNIEKPDAMSGASLLMKQ